jgi:hypothetical protein
MKKKNWGKKVDSDQKQYQVATGKNPDGVAYFIFAELGVFD